MTFVALTNKAGKTVHVNLSRVEYITPKDTGSKLIFTNLPGLGSDILFVREAPEAVVGFTTRSSA